MKRALVTGGTRGIGYAVAEELLRAGYGVTVTGTLKDGKGPRGSAFLSCNFENRRDTEVFAGTLRSSRWDVLVNSAGINTIGRLETYDPDEFERIQRVNVTAPFLLCRAVVPGMRKRKFGRILNITSIYGLVSRAERSAYSASKFGLFGLSRALALEVAGDNVLVNCLAPGFVQTDMTKKILGPAGIKAMARQIPMRRLAWPQEIASVAAFMVSPANSYMTGQTVCVDGGFTCA